MLVLMGIAASIPLVLTMYWVTKNILTEVRLLLRERHEYELQKVREQREELKVAQQLIDQEGGNGL
jgi:hypothetical protein